MPYPVPPLGLCLLASSLESDYEVKIYDGVFDEGRSLVDVVKEFNPDYIGFSIRNVDDIVADRKVFYIDRIISDFINPVRNCTNVPLIIGGSGFSMFPEELMEMTGVDYGIAGEGEKLMMALIYSLNQGVQPPTSPQILVKGQKNPGISTSVSFLELSGMKLSEIDRHIDFTPYKQRGAYSIQTKRGCSHGCIYCTYPVVEGSCFRMRDPYEIACEIEAAAKRLGDVMFEFVDSTFNDPKGHAEAICREIIKMKLKVRLRTMGINPGHSSRELFQLMIDAGFTQIDATPDSASPKVMKNLGKGFNLEETRRMADLIREFNLPTMWFFLFGGPGEDEVTFAETLDFIDQFVNPDDLVYMTAGLRIYPQTPLYNIALKEGKITAAQSILNPPAYYFPDRLPKEKLDSLIEIAARTRPNCLPANSTTPPEEMRKEAFILRQQENLTEPMFRTLLRIRKRWIAEGRL